MARRFKTTQAMTIRDLQNDKKDRHFEGGSAGWVVLALFAMPVLCLCLLFWIAKG